jgi:hypothetical protein
VSEITECRTFDRTLWSEGGQIMEKPDTVTRVSINDGALTIEVQGWDKLWSLTSRLEISLEHVTDVRLADEQPEGIRMSGTHIPGVIAAGTFVQEGSSVFWDS